MLHFFHVFLILGAVVALVLSVGALLHLAYAWLRGRPTPQPPILGLSFLALTYLAALFLLSASTVQQNHPAAKLGTLYFAFAGPLVTLLYAVILGGQRQRSVYHRMAFYAASLYLPLWLIIAGVTTWGLLSLGGE